MGGDVVDLLRADVDDAAVAQRLEMLFPVLSIVVNLVKDAAAAGSERAVVHARRPAGIGRRDALLAAFALLVVADHEVALHDVDLFPVVVYERLGRERTGVDLEEPRAAALLVLLVEIGREDLLPEAGG
jgi:hypothetical protein